MRNKIEQIMNKVESGDLAYHDAVDELLLLYNISGSVSECEHPDEARIRDGDKDFCLACNNQIDR